MELDPSPAVDPGDILSTERASGGLLLEQIRFVTESPIMTVVLGVTDAAALVVLNPQRQIVGANLRLLPERSPESLLGKRPGEALGCCNVRLGPGGCGTAPACRQCGALQAIVRAQRQGVPAEGECLLTIELGRECAPLEVKVRAVPVSIEGQRFTVVSFSDLGSQKRREALERVFFHDVANTLAGLSGWMRRARASVGDGPGALATRRVQALVEHLEREILGQRTLLEAENATLVPSPREVHCARVLESVRAALEALPVAGERRVVIESEDEQLLVDPTLLERVLVNMTKNALEATPRGGTVRAWCERSNLPGFAVVFRVHNNEVIPHEVQQFIFQRSFSTKASRGRGLGTYGMKLLGERFLQGRVGFESRDGLGTVFEIHLPRAPGSRQ